MIIGHRIATIFHYNYLTDIFLQVVGSLADLKKKQALKIQDNIQNNSLDNREITRLFKTSPYLQKYIGQIIVVKYGGNAMTNDHLKLSVMHDLYLLQAIGLKIVLVHGGGPAINQAMGKLKRKTKFINGLRYTDTTDLQIINAILSGEVNKNLVSNLIKVGAKAVGFSGVDGHLIEAKQLSPALGYVGEVTKITPDLLNLTLRNGYIPVISSIGIDQQEGQLYNINADTVAAEIAIKLQAQNFVLMTNVKGILKDADDPTSLYEKLTLAKVTKLINSNLISAGMIPKLKAITRAINSGLTQAVVLDGRVEHAILFGLLSDKNYGSLITH